jgi:integrase
MLQIPAESEKGGTHRLLPLVPEAAELFQNVAKADRAGWVFRPLNKQGEPLSRSRWAVGDAFEAIATKAGVVVGEREKLDSDGKPVIVKEYASAHDLRRAFGTRWARRVMPTVLRELMRHASVSTTMAYYVTQNAEATAEVLWVAAGNTVAPAPDPQGSAPARTRSNALNLDI